MTYSEYFTECASQGSQTEYQEYAWSDPTAVDEYDFDDSHAGPSTQPPQLELPETPISESQHIPDNDTACTHLGGSQWCLAHSNFVYSSHSDYGAPAPAMSGSALAGNDHLSPPSGDRRSRSQPPTVTRWYDDRQNHERLVAVGRGTKDVKKSEKKHRRRAKRTIKTTDLELMTADLDLKMGNLQLDGNYGGLVG